MAKPPVAEQLQVNFRMPVDLRDEIKREAEAHGRSMNAEIILALSAYYGMQGSEAFTVGDVVEKLQQRLVDTIRPSDAIRRTAEFGGMPLGDVLRKLEAAENIEAFADMLAEKVASRLKP